MKIHSLDIKNIGPFKEAHLDFNTECDATKGIEPVTIITGNNGAGKSIIIDAIRAMFEHKCLERDIVANRTNFKISLELFENGLKSYSIESITERGLLNPANYMNLNRFFEDRGISPSGWNFVVDYWSSKLPSDSFKISNMSAIKHKEVFVDTFKGRKSNLELTNFICSTDYLRSSDDPQEKKTGNFIFDYIKTIFKECLDNGEFKYIRRSDYTPIISQNGNEVSLDQLSSGNIFLLEHLLLFLCKMYSVSVLNNLPVNEIMNIPGFLLIDEIENHLHPKWQKKILGIIRKLFPNVQIILTTHSPFVVSSIKGAKIYTCLASNEGSSIVDTTDIYDNLPVDEVLLSDVFGVSPFNDEISKLMEERRNYIKAGDMDKAKEKLAELKAINPGYFMFLSPNEY